MRGVAVPLSQRAGDLEKKGKEEEGSLFTEEDFAMLEHDLFLNSRPKARAKADEWKE